jgi:hypothetical protein
MAKKWNKLLARIQALEDAVAALLSGTGKKKTGRKAKKKSAPGKPGRKTASRAKSTARAVGKSPVRKSAKAAKKAPRRKSSLRVAVAEAAPILPQTPLALL